jgi:serine/threonine protein kinase
MGAWYVDYPNRQEGPLTDDALRALALTGKLRREDRVSRDRQTWTTASEVPGLEFADAIATQPNFPWTQSTGDGTNATVVCDDVAPRQSEKYLDLGEVVAGHEIMGVLGAGSMGVIYRARQTALNRSVALKMVRVGRQTQEVALARFLQEAQAVARLRHPNIVTAYDTGRHGARAWFTMELLDGETLESRLEREPLCTEEFTCGVIRQAAAGLGHAAAAGVVHRDVKPGNLFLTPPPTGYPLPPGLPMVKVTDFGLARLKSADQSEAQRLTAAGLIVGTPLYMSPEQINGGETDHRADVYALGVTAYEMIAGTAPFQGGNMWNLIERKLAGELPPLPNASPATNALLAAMTVTDVAKRLGSYEELLGRIDEVLHAIGTPTHVVPPRPESSRGALARAPLEDSGRGETKKAAARPRWLVLSVLLALLVTLSAVAAWRHFTTAPPPSMSPTARAETLFRGTLVDWLPLRGFWRIDKDAEGATVVAGTDGVIRRSLPTYDHYSLAVGTDLHKSGAVELHFGLEPYSSGAASPGLPRYVLRVSREEGARFGRRASDDAPFVATSAAVPVPRVENWTDKVPYFELRAERQGRWWHVYFNRQYLGALPDRGPAKVDEFRLLVEGGTAHFDAAEVAEMK